MLQYLQQHSAEVEPLMTFLTTFPEPPVPRAFQHLPSSVGMTLFKPAHEHYSPQRTPAAFEVYGLPNRAKSLAIDAIMRGGEPEDAGGASDSDTDFSDRVLQVGEWYDVLDTANKWLCAQVLQVEGSKVFVRYSGWSDRWNEWHDMSSPKIHRLGTKTSRKQVDERFKKGKPQQQQPQPPQQQQQQQQQQPPTTPGSSSRTYQMPGSTDSRGGGWNGRKRRTRPSPPFVCMSRGRSPSSYNPSSVVECYLMRTPCWRSSARSSSARLSRSAASRSSASSSLCSFSSSRAPAPSSTTIRTTPLPAAASAGKSDSDSGSAIGVPASSNSMHAALTRHLLANCSFT